MTGQRKRSGGPRTRVAGQKSARRVMVRLTEDEHARLARASALNDGGCPAKVLREALLSYLSDCGL